MNWFTYPDYVLRAPVLLHRVLYCRDVPAGDLRVAGLFVMDSLAVWCFELFRMPDVGRYFCDVLVQVPALYLQYCP